ncbi:MAG: 50S ribosomal protein L10 [Bacteroidales bacterium]|jgi:large subunit ribosomal protein L10|nr:50S ribosomal protein L10 [Bacteroidales bacterium]
MRKEDKYKLIAEITDLVNNSDAIYIADIAGFNAEQSSLFRRQCFKNEVSLKVVKNTLLKRAMEEAEKDYSELYPILTGPTSLMLSNSAKAPAKLIKEFRKKSEKPILKGAFVMDMTVIGDDKLDYLVSIKSKEEVIGDVIAALQSPINNVVGALKSQGQKIAGILETLSEKAA